MRRPRVTLENTAEEPLSPSRHILYIDIGALGSSEAQTLLSASEPLWKAAARDIKDFLRFGGRFRPPMGSLRSWKFLRSKRPIRKRLAEGTLVISMLIVDPQLADSGLKRLRKLASRYRTIRIMELRAAITSEHGLSINRLYLGAFGTPSQRAVGASLFREKTNVSLTDYREVLGIPALDFARMVRGIADDLNPDLIILRMNAEGIELDVLENLDAVGFLGRIDLLCGSGHDLKKIDLARYQDLLGFLNDNDLAFETFGGDDWRRAKFLRHYENSLVNADLENRTFRQVIARMPAANNVR